MFAHNETVILAANDDVEGSDEDSDGDTQSLSSQENLCLPALDYLKHCCRILASMWELSNSPVLSGAHRYVRYFALEFCTQIVFCHVLSDHGDIKFNNMYIYYRKCPVM